MIQTYWQPSYQPTPKAVKAVVVKTTSVPKARKAIFTEIKDSVIAQRILAVLETTPSVSAMNMRELANTASAYQYLKLLYNYGHITFKLIRCPRTGMLVKHYSLKENHV